MIAHLEVREMVMVSHQQDHGKKYAGATMQVGAHMEPVVSSIIDVQYVINTDTGLTSAEKLILVVTHQMVITIPITMDQEVREEKVGQTTIIIIITLIKVRTMELRKKRNTIITIIEIR